MIGIVRNITPKKGFGFIRGEDNREYFFHKDDFNGHWLDLEADMNAKMSIRVEFSPTAGKKGLRAEQVSRMDWPNQAAT